MKPSGPAVFFSETFGIKNLISIIDTDLSSFQKKKLDRSCSSKFQIHLHKIVYSIILLFYLFYYSLLFYYFWLISTLS